MDPRHPHDRFDQQDDQFFLQQARNNRKGQSKRQQLKQTSQDQSSLFTFQQQGGGDQFMATKPWMGAIRPPSNFNRPPRNQNSAPNTHLTLEHVHGYRAKDCRNNLYYLPQFRIIYHAAALGIVYDKSFNQQFFFDKHVDDITAFALNPQKTIAASGQIGRHPNIFVWEIQSMRQVCNFKAPLQNGIAALAFSPSGTKLVAIAMDDNHSVAIFNLRQKSVIVSQKGDRQKILSVAWISQDEFVTAGIKHFKVWTAQAGNLRGKKGQFGNNNNVLLSLAVQGNSALTGTAGGTVIRWIQGNSQKGVKIHQKAVDSIWCSQTHVVTGGKDGLVHLLDPNLNIQFTVDFNEPQFQSVSPLIRSAQINAQGDCLLVGTYGSEIFQYHLPSGQFKNYVRGHFTPSRGRTVTNQVWGLAVMPDGQTYISSSDDGTLRVWNIEQKQQVRIIRFTVQEPVPEQAKARCLAVYTDGSLIAIGFKDGSFKILQTSNWMQIEAKKDRKQEISDLKFSPDGSRLAVGSHDNFIDIYSLNPLRRIGVCRGHSSYITHIDWSRDGSYLHSNCGAYQLLFWDGNSGQQITSGASMLRDEEWETWTSVLGWPVQGIFPPYSDGTDVNAVDRSKLRYENDCFLVATADDFSLVKVFRYPCLAKGAEAVVGRGHSSHVTNVRFGREDGWLFSTGGDDQCVFQWKLS